jgi:hypothetical protein
MTRRLAIPWPSMNISTCWLTIGFLGLACGAAFGAQSVQVTTGNPRATLPNSAPWTTMGQNTKSMRWEMRIHNFGADWPQTGMILGPFYLYKQAGVGVWIEAGGTQFDPQGNNGALIANCCAQFNDVLVRVQRNANNGTLVGAQWTFEICPLPGGVCLSAVNPITSYSTTTNWQGMQITLTSGYSVAFLRWFSGAVPVGTTIPLAGVSGDLADWEFEGNLNDSSGHGLNMSGGSVTYAASPTYAPACNAGPQQVFRAGAPAHLDGRGSQALDGTTGGLTYLWQYIEPTEPGAPKQQLLWSSHTISQPTIRGMIFGPVNIRLTVTDSSNQSSTCTVHDGAVPTDANGNVTIADPRVNVLLGPMTRMDRSCDLSSCSSSSLNPWPWADQIQFAWGIHMGLAQGTAPTGITNFIKTWETRTTPGTISVNTGSSAVTGSGTTFGNTFCGSSAVFPCTPLAANNLIIIWYCTSGTAPACFDSVATSGRRYYGISSILSQTSLTISGGSANQWTLSSCSGCYYSAWSLSSNSWFGGSTNNNYYDDVKAFYATYYRTGVEDFLSYANWLADAWYNSPSVDKLTCGSGDSGLGCPFPRIVSLEGTALRAMQEDAAAGSAGSSTKWTGLRRYFDFAMSENTRCLGVAPTVGGCYDLREESYLLASVAVCAITDPGDAARVTNCLTNLNTALTSRWAPARQSNGSWVAPYCTTLSNAGFCSSTGGLGTITAATGSRTITLTGGAWSSAHFCNAGNTAYVMMGTLPGPTSDSPYYDTRGYIATFVDTTHATLDVNYLGSTGSGKSILVGCGGGPNNWVGPTVQPFMLGITSNAMRLSAYALVNSGSSPPFNATLAGTINTSWLPGIATFLGTGAFDTDSHASIPDRGPWYGVGGGACQPPYGPKGNVDCSGGSSAQEVRMLSPELVAAISTAYCLTRDPNLLAYGDNYYSAMFAKFPLDSGYDIGWIADMDIHNFFWNLYAGKWWGFFWGYGRTQSWVSARQGCVSAPVDQILNVGFKLASVPNATQVRVTLTKPDGTTVSNTCTSSPCAVTADAREGSHLVTLTYLSASGSVLATSSEQAVVDVN